MFARAWAVVGAVVGGLIFIQCSNRFAHCSSWSPISPVHGGARCDFYFSFWILIEQWIGIQTSLIGRARTLQRKASLAFFFGEEISMWFPEVCCDALAQPISIGHFRFWIFHFSHFCVQTDLIFLVRDIRASTKHVQQPAARKLMMNFLVHTEELLLFPSEGKNVYDGFYVFKMTIWNLNNNANNDGVHSSRKVENTKKNSKNERQRADSVVKNTRRAEDAKSFFELTKIIHFQGFRWALARRRRWWSTDSLCVSLTAQVGAKCSALKNPFSDSQRHINDDDDDYLNWKCQELYFSITNGSLEGMEVWAAL